MPFEIHRTIILSTGHVDPRELPQLEDHASMSSDDGWLLYTGRDIDPKTAPTLTAAVALAVRENCVFIRFDSDGPLVAELPTYEW